jgi:secreted trypsin-like serine protease
MLTLFISAALANHPIDLASETDPGLPLPVHIVDGHPIIHGEDATKDEWPMAGGLLATGTGNLGGIEMEGRLLMCTSTLIAPDVVLTAAHCVDLDGMVEEIEKQAGITGITISDAEFAWTPKTDLTEYQFSLDGPAPYPATVGVGSATTYPDAWDLSSVSTGLATNDDVALLFLDTPMEDVPFGYLITEAEDAQFAENEDVVIVGWGQQTADQQPPAGTVGVKKMGTSFVAELGDTEFKVGETSDDVRKCHGDSGGPSFFEVDTDSTETWRVVGVTSHAYRVDIDDPTGCLKTGGVDTRVSAYLDWIDEEMRSACDDGIRSWCRIEGILPPPDADGNVLTDGGEVVWNTSEGEVFSAAPGGDEESPKGCGCTTTPSGFSSLVGWGLGLGLLGRVRRKRR